MREIGIRSISSLSFSLYLLPSSKKLSVLTLDSANLFRHVAFLDLVRAVDSTDFPATGEGFCLAREGRNSA